MSTPAGASRRPWVAVAFTLLLPGLGHLYAGRPRRALLLWFTTLLFGTIVVATVAVFPSALLLYCGLLAAVLLLGFIAWDAARAVRDARGDFALRRYNRWYVYAGALVAFIFVIQPLHFRFLTTLLRAYQLPSISMEPTLLLGDYVLARPLNRSPVRGQIVVYRHGRATYVKRVIGLPADTLSMRQGVLLVNGSPIREPYAAQVREPDVYDTQFAWQRRFLAGSVDSSAYRPTRDSWGPIVVPLGYYFILGDNRAASADSRHLGFVAARSILERPVLVYFSRDPGTGGVRWGRIGTRIAGAQ